MRTETGGYRRVHLRAPVAASSAKAEVGERSVPCEPIRAGHSRSKRYEEQPAEDDYDPAKRSEKV